MASGFARLPWASGEAGPGRPVGKGTVPWDRVLAVRQWPSNQSNTTRVSSIPKAPVATENSLNNPWKDWETICLVCLHLC